MPFTHIMLNLFFHKRTFCDLIYCRENAIYKGVAERYAKDLCVKTNLDVVTEIYDFMSLSHRNEYIYQNSVFNMSFGATILPQFPVGKSKADLVVVGDEPVVCEIKSDLDGFQRLKTQIVDYQKVFKNVIVITNEHYAGKLCKLLDENVGISVLDCGGDIEIRREPQPDGSKLDHLVIFKSLRKREFENVIIEKFGHLPKAAQVFHYDECFKFFKEIPIDDVCDCMTVQLKKRKMNDVCNVPGPLKSLVCFSDVLSKRQELLNDFLNKNYGE